MSDSTPQEKVVTGVWTTFARRTRLYAVALILALVGNAFALWSLSTAVGDLNAQANHDRQAGKPLVAIIYREGKTITDLRQELAQAAKSPVAKRFVAEQNAICRAVHCHIKH